MSAIMIEDISPELYEKLEQQARHHHRNITQQVIALLEQAMTQYPIQSPPTAMETYVKELEIINQRAERLNEEALDVLAYQVEL